jgi:biopolymer transport protein ExbD
VPLVDVMLVLLIIFMMAAPMMQREWGQSSSRPSQDGDHRNQFT